ncbi:MAG TPA: polysulfide reductase NrfD [Smithellaceae bacterium]|jgi:molybdopterin-containing oxidoreductase family membrane subunit|nr:polysulfide reductase NrfD [Smithellaceae bacterium]HQK91028.1 polysulfide reductase NrfD [Smithellaceae bacterium]
MGCPENSSWTGCLKDAGRRVFSGGPVYLFFLGLFAALLVAGVAAGIHSVYIVGSRHAYGTTREIPLAMLIATYTFFVITSTGLCLVSSIGHIFGVERFMPIAKRAVLLSVITIMSGFLVIGLELENPLRLAVYLFCSPNFTSNIWWMGVLYAFEVVLLILEFIFLLLDKHKASVAAGLLGILFGIAAISNLGGVFAMLNGREFWYGPYLPIFFIASALLMGCAAVIFFTVLAYRVHREPLDRPMADALATVGKLAGVMLAVNLFFTIWRMVTLAVGGTHELLVRDALVSGPFAFNFWALEVGLGMILPFALILWSAGKRIGPIFLASALVIFSSFFVRLDMVVAGQIVPLYWELGVREYAKLNAYSPTGHEILVVLAGVGLTGAAFLLGEKVFQGFREVEDAGSRFAEVLEDAAQEPPSAEKGKVDGSP